MPSVSEGLSTPGLEENVNSESGFEAALARKAGTTEVLEAREPELSTSIAEGLTVGTDDPIRDLQGRYAAAAGDTPEEDEDTPDEGTDEGAAPDLDPSVAALLEKHGGDPVAALAELNERFTNAQTVIGRQGNELGQVRTEVAELRGRVEGIASVTAQQPQQQLTADDISEMVASSGGASTAMWAVQNGDDNLVEAVVREWAKQNELEGEGTFEPLAFRQDWLAFKAKQAQPAPQVTPQRDPYAQRLEQVDQMSGALGVLQSQSADWDTFAPHLMAALEASPKAVLEMVNSHDPQVQLDGMSLVADKARVIASTTAAATTASGDAAREAATQRKLAAQVATGSLRPVAGERDAGTEEQQSAARVAAFKAALLATETTSVADGLTFGK